MGNLQIGTQDCVVNLFTHVRSHIYKMTFAHGAFTHHLLVEQKWYLQYTLPSPLDNGSKQARQVCERSQCVLYLVLPFLDT